MYSQNREDEIISSYYAPTYKGAFLDLGANDGSTLSNSLALVQRGWKGVCVEPDRAAFRRLSNIHRNNDDIQCVPVAIGNEDGVGVFYEAGDHLGKGDTGLLSSLKQSNFDRFPGTQRVAVDVEIWTVKTLLERMTLKQFDFISIDIEEMDLDIMRQMDFKAMGTSMVCVEFNGVQEKEYTDHAAKFGMKLIAKNGENLIFAL